jgi:hypothetical protein
MFKQHFFQDISHISWQLAVSLSIHGNNTGRLSVRGARSDDRREIGPRHSESWMFVD